MTKQEYEKKTMDALKSCHKDRLELASQCYHKDETISVLENRITELEFDNRSLVKQMNQIAQIADKGE